MVGEGQQHIGHSGVIFRGTHKGDPGHPIGPVHTLEIRIHKASGDLAGPVRAEVKEDNGVPIVHPGTLEAYHRLHKFVGNSGIVGSLHGIHRIGMERPFSSGHSIIGALNPIPALIPVHGVVSSHDRCNLTDTDLCTFGLKVFHKALARGGRDVPAVQEAMDIYLCDTLLLGHP